jgi:hypothetical protein
MSTDLRNVPDCVAQNELTQTRFWGGKDRMTCVQITQRNPQYNSDHGGDMFNHLQLTKHQARQLAVELMLFAEGREVEGIEEFQQSFTDEIPDEEASLAMFETFKATGARR